MTAAHSRIRAGVLQQTPLEVVVSPQGLWDHRAKEKQGALFRPPPRAAPGGESSLVEGAQAGGRQTQCDSRPCRWSQCPWASVLFGSSGVNGATRFSLG